MLNIETARVFEPHWMAWRIVGLDLPEDLTEHLVKELVKLTQEP